MHFREYMKTVDQKLEQLSAQEMKNWIREQARKQATGQRTAFLNDLTKKPAVAEHSAEDVTKAAAIKNQLAELEKKAAFIECQSLDQYEEIYWDSENVCEYNDPFEIGTKLTAAFCFAENLLFSKQYFLAAELYERLCRVSFPVYEPDNDITQELEMGIEELVLNKLAAVDLKEAGLFLLYSHYQTLAGEKRAAALYRYLNWDVCRLIKIEDVFAVGPEELLDADEFMEDWIRFLSKTPGNQAGEWLAEACLYQGGLDALIEEADKTWEQHPLLYEEACIYLLKEERFDECEAVGLRAVEQLSEKWVIRGAIADLAAEAALQLGHKDALAVFYPAAFYSFSTIPHYLRLFELPNAANLVQEAAHYAQHLPSHATNWYGENRQVNQNSLSLENKLVVRFFNHEFEAVYEAAKQDGSALGWSKSFKGIAVPLFLLLLDKTIVTSKAKAAFADSLTIFNEKVN